MRKNTIVKYFLMTLGIAVYLLGVPFSIRFWFGMQAHFFALAIMCFSCAVTVGSFVCAARHWSKR